MDLAQHEIFRANVGKGGIIQNIQAELTCFKFICMIYDEFIEC